jgi:hypothetical protein
MDDTPMAAAMWERSRSRARAAAAGGADPLRLDLDAIAGTPDPVKQAWKEQRKALGDVQEQPSADQASQSQQDLARLMEVADDAMEEVKKVTSAMEEIRLGATTAGAVVATEMAYDKALVKEAKKKLVKANKMLAKANSDVQIQQKLISKELGKAKKGRKIESISKCKIMNCENPSRPGTFKFCDACLGDGKMTSELGAARLAEILTYVVDHRPDRGEGGQQDPTSSDFKACAEQMAKERKYGGAKELCALAIDYAVRELAVMHRNLGSTLLPGGGWKGKFTPEVEKAMALRDDLYRLSEILTPGEGAAQLTEGVQNPYIDRYFEEQTTGNVSTAQTQAPPEDLSTQDEMAKIPTSDDIEIADAIAEAKALAYQAVLAKEQKAADAEALGQLDAVTKWAVDHKAKGASKSLERAWKADSAAQQPTATIAATIASATADADKELELGYGDWGKPDEPDKPDKPDKPSKTGQEEDIVARLRREQEELVERQKREAEERAARKQREAEERAAGQQHTVEELNERMIQAASEGETIAMNEYIWGGVDKNVVDEEGWGALHQASFEGHLKCVEELIETHQADINKVTQNSYGHTPLMLAAYSNKLPVVELLIAHGADHIIKNKQEDTALDIAMEEGHDDVLTLLGELDYPEDEEEEEEQEGAARQPPLDEKSPKPEPEPDVSSTREPHYNADEDSHLRELVGQLGIKAWEDIAFAFNKMEGHMCERLPRSLRKRWNTALSPEITAAKARAKARAKQIKA